MEKRAVLVFAVYLGIALPFPPRVRANDANVKQFGAKGDGVADDAPAVQRAVKYVDSTKGGTVYFPPGIYLFKETVKSQAGWTSFRGSNKLASVIVVGGNFDGLYQNVGDPGPYGYWNTSSAQVPGTGSIVRFGSFQDLQISCRTLGVGNAIEVSSGVGYFFSNLKLTGCASGILMSTVSSGGYTEETQTQQIICSQDTYCVNLQAWPNTTTSFAYGRWDLYCENGRGGVLGSVPPWTGPGACLRVGTYAWFYGERASIRQNSPLPAVEIDGSTGLPSGAPSLEVSDVIDVAGEDGIGGPAIVFSPRSLVEGIVINGTVSGFLAHPLWLLKADGANWASSHAYSAGATVNNAGCSGKDRFMAVVAGTSGSSAPAWSGACSTVGATVRDGSVTWRDIGYIPGYNGGFAGPISNGNFGGSLYISSDRGAPDQTCWAGSIYTNPLGRSGSTLYACVGGSWVNEW
jgi:hypothetical protein